MPNFVGKPRAEDPVRWFQRTRKLKVDGIAGKQTRQALIAEYMSLDGASLRDFVGEIDATAHGCGENFPLDDDGKELDRAPADGKPDPIDRRVELFFFDNEFGITPPPPGSNSKPGSKEYPLWRKRVVEKVVLRREDGAGPKVQFVELMDAHFRTDSAVVLPEGEDPDQKGQHGALSAAGFIATVLRLNEEQPGRGILVAGHTDTAASDTHNDELSRLRAQVALSLLEGDRDSFKSLANQRHKPADINQILSWVSKAFRDLRFDCDPGKISDTVDSGAVRRFQKAFNVNKAALGSTAADLVVDGVVGEQTWGAFFDCYELDLRRELGEDAAGLAALRDELRFVDDSRKSLGFGEHFPIDELGVDNFRSQTNRRVEVLFFNPGEEPDLAQTEADVQTSEVYLPGHYARESVPTRKTARVVRVSFVPGSFQSFRIEQAPFSIRTDAGVVVKGSTDASGTVAAKLPGDTTGFVLTVQDPAPLPEFQTLFEQQYQLGALSPADTPLGAIQRLRMLGLWTGPELAVFSEGTTDALRYFQLLACLEVK
jgi:peptidoglycan hydrolase-like protein with peptidoglycan-binding domain